MINYITGISDGLLLPTIPCALIALNFFDASWSSFFWFNLAGVGGALAYGLARFLGEKEEIKHNHPDIAQQDLFNDKERLRHVGIDETLIDDMMQQVGQEQARWLEEVKENEMGWEYLDSNRARNAGLQTGAGFLIGTYLIALPFPLLFTQNYQIALYLFASLLTLFLFGCLKGKYIYSKPLPAAVSQLLKGVLVLLILILFFGMTIGWWA